MRFSSTRAGAVAAVAVLGATVSVAPSLAGSRLLGPPVIKAAHGVLSPKTSVTPAVNVTSDAHFRHLKGGFKLTVAGQKFQARALCLEVAKNRLIGNRGLSFQPVHPWFDAVITAVIHPAGQPPEHILLEQTDLDGAPEGDGGRVSFEFGNGTVMFHFKGACWRPFLLPVNADGATEIK